ncbi:Hypothetical predicted protein, partial [Pelobates cultripes]
CSECSESAHLQHQHSSIQCNETRFLQRFQIVCLHNTDSYVPKFGSALTYRCVLPDKGSEPTDFGKNETGINIFPFIHWEFHGPPRERFSLEDDGVGGISIFLVSYWTIEIFLFVSCEQ